MAMRDSNEVLSAQPLPSNMQCTTFEMATLHQVQNAAHVANPDINVGN